MKRKSLIISGALALSLLASPATLLASTGEQQVQKQANVNIESVLNWVYENEEALKSNNLQQADIQSLLKQFGFPSLQGTPAPAQEQPKQEQPAPKQEQPKAEPKAEEPAQEQPKAQEQPAEQQQVQEQQTAEDNQAASEVSAFEKEVVELTNQERQKQGLAPLQLDTELSKVAKDKSLDMQQNNYFSHNSPTHGSPFDMMKAYGIDYRTAGENIAKGQTSPQQVVQGWMNSQGHRENIMNPNFTHIGVGHAEGGNYWTQMFIGK
ncbi:CAP domain-containing protein [Halobacillus sp. Marseille-Q1614]|uniref:CAP domain-containing protein n=1 Tax=Halobacillus sp. Marseille-Q1614 TaxID=2709134 RepID=UPI00156F15EE|nr:CAP domain-containing protein [Halobacillus sp. Marseille-Q1614]